MARWIGLPMVLSAMLPFADSRPAPRPDSLPDITFNDNLNSAGRLVRGTLTLELDIVNANWRPTDPKGDPIEVLAFAEPGKTPQNPGPMIRVPLGTALRVTVTNRSGITIAVRGLTSRKQEMPDSLLLAPGASGEARFTADAEGTFYYWAGAPGRRLTGLPPTRRIYEDSQLNGAFIVDPPGAGRPSNERIFVIGVWNRGPDSAGAFNHTYEIYTINGRPWPGTERLSYTMGDSVHWRVINASADVHPLHLHGFYFRVDSRGDMTRDTLYWPSERRMAVTERLLPGTTMQMAWSPDRPGGWVFHCHLTFHIVPNPQLGAQRLPPDQRKREITFGHSHADPQHHVEQGMGGLMMAINVRPSPGWKPSTDARRTIRLFVMTDSTAADTVRRFGYLSDEGGGEPLPGSIRAPGSTLVLHRGEPTTIWVINRAGEPTAIHWHGMELESPFDGVVGVGGYTGSPTPTILPGDSFEVRMTPPRAGSFMYHTHVNDIRQLRGGLWAPLLVLEPGETRDTTRDLVFMTGEGSDYTALLNGSLHPAPVSLVAGRRYRIRLMNISASFPNLQYWLTTGDEPLVWTPVARDGFALPPWQRTPRRAEEFVAMGQIADFEFVAPAGGPLELVSRQGVGILLARQSFTLKKP